MLRERVRLSMRGKHVEDVGFKLDLIDVENSERGARKGIAGEQREA